MDLVALGLVPSVGGYVLLGISLFFTLLSALALAVVMSAFSENVRGAQALVGYIYPLIFLPAMALIYLDVNTLPLAAKSSLLRHPLQPPHPRSKSSSHRRLRDSCVRDCLRCHLHGSHNVHRFTAVCNGEDFDGKTKVRQGKSKTLKRIKDLSRDFFYHFFHHANGFRKQPIEPTPLRGFLPSPYRFLQ